MHLLIRQARVVAPSSEFHDQVVDVLIQDGIIKNIGKDIKDKDAKVIEGKGLHIAPGFTDIFADYREPGYEHKETISSGLDAAAAGGFTHVMVVPNTNPTVSTKSAVQYLIKRAQNHAVNLHPLGALTKDTEGKVLAEMLDMHANGAIAFTDGWKPVQNANLMLKGLEYVKAFNGTLLQIPADAALSEGGLMHEGPVSTKLGMAGIPSLSEIILLHRDIELLRYTGSRLHVTGVSSAEGVEMIRKAKAEGLNITCSVTPYHLALNDEALSTYNSLYKVTPPIRSEADRQALIAGLKDGTIDCIASHHRPQEWDAKAKEFEYASDGMNIQQMAFSIAYEVVRKIVPLERLVDAMAVKPREIFGLSGGKLSKGETADIVVFDLGMDPFTEDVLGLEKFRFEEMKSLSANNPFIGNEFNGMVLGIINNGQTSL
jgi:dihydroorotase